MDPRVTALVAAACSSLLPGRADAAVQRDPIGCRGCLLEVPDGPRPKPVLVLLHGDEGAPTKLFAAWRNVAKKRHMVLFAPRCPIEKGCTTRSWWRWNGEPAWLERQIDALAKRHPLRRRQLYLAGWSGGATYMGMRAPAWGDRFAALSFAGGGAPPHTTDCARRPYPARYMMGGRNPYFDLASATKRALERCRHRVLWQPLAGASHSGTWRRYASPQNLGTAADWLLQQRLPLQPSGANSSSR